MRHSVKIPLIIAGTLIVLGLIVVIAGAALNGTDWFFQSRKYVDQTLEVSDPFDSLKVTCDACDVKFAAAEDGKCRIDAHIPETMQLTAEVKNSTLTITCKDKRKWYQFIGFHSDESKMTVYLPETEYNSLLLTSASGNAEIPGDFSFRTAKFITSSGDVQLMADIKDDLSITLSSGNLELRNLKGSPAVDLTASSGDLYLADLQCGAMNIHLSSGDLTIDNAQPASLKVKTASGEIQLRSVVCSGTMSVQTSSGDISFYGCDGAEVKFETSSGDVKGSLLTGKTFHTHTSSGDVRVPGDEAGGDCTVKTSSGDIQITIQK